MRISSWQKSAESKQRPFSVGKNALRQDIITSSLPFEYTSPCIINIIWLQKKLNAAYTNLLQWPQSFWPHFVNSVRSLQYDPFVCKLYSDHVFYHFVRTSKVVVYFWIMRCLFYDRIWWLAKWVNRSSQVFGGKCTRGR